MTPHWINKNTCILSETLVINNDHLKKSLPLSHKSIDYGIQSKQEVLIRKPDDDVNDTDKSDSGHSRLEGLTRDLDTRDNKISKTDTDKTIDNS